MEQEYGHKLLTQLDKLHRQEHVQMVNEFTCPGFTYVPRKPWPFGNEYHDAGCADCDIIGGGGGWI